MDEKAALRILTAIKKSKHNNVLDTPDTNQLSIKNSSTNDTNLNSDTGLMSPKILLE
jgi:hypothetical protein